MEAVEDEVDALLSSSSTSASDVFSCSELAAHRSSSTGAEGCSKSLRAALLDEGGGISGSGMQMRDERGDMKTRGSLCVWTTWKQH